ncbi:hypothetical protein B296_00048408 [Ensete ventricosum]|uniref:Uncharacterized protein n=1 Tax=Ensete ventricosum TaxID=4639 RepID=A0A426YE77_ENSVE|nr:hypothetical protein B296_00048408 [Ensete ventricosum]
MTRGDIVVEATSSNNTEPLLPSRVSYARSLSRVDDELESFPSCIRWMCVDESDVRYTVVPLPPLGCFCPHYLSLRPLLYPHPSRL